MGQILEGAGEGEVIGLGGRCQDVVHPWLLCKRREGHVIREDRGQAGGEGPGSSSQSSSCFPGPLC